MNPLPTTSVVLFGILLLPACGSSGKGVANNDPGNPTGGSGGKGAATGDAGPWAAGGKGSGGAGASGSACVPHKEKCDGKDDNCDGKVDNGSNLCPTSATCTGDWSCTTTNGGLSSAHHAVTVETGRCIDGSCETVTCHEDWGCYCANGCSGACTDGTGCNDGFVGTHDYYDSCQGKGYPVPDDCP